MTFKFSTSEMETILVKITIRKTLHSDSKEMSGCLFNHMNVVCRGFDLSDRLEVPENGLLCCGASEGFQQLREIFKAMWVVRQPEVVATET